uniref:Uncharacterized protein n=1 Tax=Parastrongyloides trichosuri TaxID=131310 RepID=A0A0N4Z7F7_PARTI
MRNAQIASGINEMNNIIKNMSLEELNKAIKYSLTMSESILQEFGSWDKIRTEKEHIKQLIEFQKKFEDDNGSVLSFVSNQSSFVPESIPESRTSEDLLNDVLEEELNQLDFVEEECNQQDSNVEGLTVIDSIIEEIEHQKDKDSSQVISKESTESKDGPSTSKGFLSKFANDVSGLFSKKKNKNVLPLNNENTLIRRDNSKNIVEINEAIAFNRKKRGVTK